MNITEARKILTHIDNLSRSRNLDGVDKLALYEMKRVIEESTGCTEEEIRGTATFSKTSDRIEIPVSSGKTLVAEKNPDPDFKEVFIYLEDENGAAYQDLAIVGEDYSLNNNDSEDYVKPETGKYVVDVFADEYSEDYTDKFRIPEYKEEKYDEI